MARYSGKNLYWNFVHSGGTLVLSTDYRTLEITEAAKEIDTTAGADAYASVLAGAIDSTWSAEYLEQTAGTANYGTLTPGLAGTLTWGPEGTTSGKPKYTAAAILLSHGPSYAYGDTVTIRLSGRLTAATTIASY